MTPPSLATGMEILGGLAGLAVLFWLKWVSRKTPNNDRLRLLLEDDHAPGDVVRAELLTDFAPLEASVVFELYREDDDRPVRSAPAHITAPEKTAEGWRCAIRASLPEDARPPFAGGWALTVEARTGEGRRVLQMEPVPLKEFCLEPRRPVAPGGVVEGVLCVPSRPPELMGSLELFRDGEQGEPLRVESATVSAPVQTPQGWRCVVSAVMPRDARPEPGQIWVLAVCDSDENAPIPHVADEVVVELSV